MTIDFEISDVDGKSIIEGQIPYMVLEQDVPERIVEGFGIMYRVPATHVTKIIFTEKMPAIKAGETLTFFAVPGTP